MFKIGQVIRVHGTKGEVVVTTESGLPLPENDLLYLKNQSGDLNPVRVQEIRKIEKGGKISFFVLFTGISDRAAADAIKNFGVFSETAPEISADADELLLEDYTLIDENGKNRGTVIGIHENPAHPLLEVEHESGIALVPLVDAYITDINHKKQTITGQNLNGLFEL